MTASHTRFHVCVHRAKGGYFARVRNLPGCLGRGATEVEAIENARIAIRHYLWVLQTLAGERPTVELDITA